MHINKFKHKLLPTIIYLAFMIFFLNQCTTKSSTESNETFKDSQSVEEPPLNKPTLPTYTVLKSILFTNTDVERASFIGKNLKLAISKETAEVADSASNYKGFTQYFNNSDDEFVDIQYFNNGDQVTAVNFDIYLNKQVDVDNLYDELLLNFNSKYGKPTTKGRDYEWKLPNNQTLLLKDVSVKLAPGLQVQFAIKNTNTTIE